MLKIRVKAKPYWGVEAVDQVRKAATWACKYHDLLVSPIPIPVSYTHLTLPTILLV